MKLFLKIILGILVLILIAIGFIYIKGDEYVKSMAQDQVQNMSQGTYNFTTDELDIGLFPPSINASGVKLFSKDSIYIKQDSANAMMAFFTAENINIEDIGIIDAIFNNTIAFKLDVDKPILKIKKSTKVDSAITLQKNKQGNSSKLIINGIDVTKGKLEFSQPLQTMETNFNLRSDKLNTEGSLSQMINGLAVSLSNFELTNDKTLTRLSADNIELSNGSMEAQNLAYKTILDKYELGQELGHEADWYDISIESVVAQNSGGFYKSDTIMVSSLTIGALEGTIFRDKRLKFPNIPDKPLPHELISNIKIPFRVDKVTMKSSNITYQEQISDSPKPGHVSFKNLTVEGTGLSNFSSKFDLRASALLMGKGQLDVRIMIPSSAAHLPYEVYGTIYEQDITSINPMINYVARVNLEEGTLKKSTFEFTHDGSTSRGKINLAYDNLDFKLINPNGSTTLGKIGKSVASFFANTFIIENDNLRSEGLHEGEISFQRDPKKSVINFWWKSLFSGIIATLELPISAKSKKS